MNIEMDKQAEEDLNYFLNRSEDYSDEFYQDRKASYRIAKLFEQRYKNRDSNEKLSENQIRNIVRFMHRAHFVPTLIIWAGLQYDMPSLLQVHPHVSDLLIEIALSRNSNSLFDSYMNSGPDSTNWLREHGFID